MWNKVYKIIIASMSFGTLLATSTCGLSICTYFPKAKYGERLLIAFFIAVFATFAYSVAVSLFNDYFKKLKIHYNNFKGFQSPIEFLEFGDSRDDKEITPEQLSELLSKIPEDILKRSLNKLNDSKT